MDNLDHVAFAVRNIDESLEFYKKHFGFELESREVIESTGTELAFLKLENTKIELVASEVEGNPIKKFIEKKGPGMHHVCYRVDDIKAEMRRLESEGIELLDKEPRPGAHNTLICFFHPKSTEGVLVELCQYQ